MDRAPLPPHERPWRHPSELGRPEHEPTSTSTSGRVLIATTATVSLLLLGLLVLSMNPGQGASPEALASTTSGRATVAAALEQPPLPVVTPVGDDGWAVTTTRAARGRTGMMSARLPTGDLVEVEIVHSDESSGLTLVSLPTATEGYQLAADQPAPSDTVVVHGQPPQVVTMLAIARLDVAEGTPVIDDDGDLVGLCAMDAGSMAVLTVSTMPGSDTSTTSTAVPTTTPARPTTTAVTPTTSPVIAPTTSSPSPVPVSSAPTTVATTVPAPTGLNVAGASTTAPG